MSLLSAGRERRKICETIGHTVAPKMIEKILLESIFQDVNNKNETGSSQTYSREIIFDQPYSFLHCGDWLGL